MNSHREWFYEYEKYYAGDVFVLDELIDKIEIHERVKLLLKDRRIKTIPNALYILDLAKNLIFVSKMSDDDFHTILKKYR